jgi:hypothetical protein
MTSKLAETYLARDEFRRSEFRRDPISSFLLPSEAGECAGSAIKKEEATKRLKEESRKAEGKIKN